MKSSYRAFTSIASLLEDNRTDDDYIMYLLFAFCDDKVSSFVAGLHWSKLGDQFVRVVKKIRVALPVVLFPVHGERRFWGKHNHPAWNVL